MPVTALPPQGSASASSATAAYPGMPGYPSLQELVFSAGSRQCHEHLNSVGLAESLMNQASLTL
jgi:hypothetical protein